MKTNTCLQCDMHHFTSLHYDSVIRFITVTSNVGQSVWHALEHEEQNITPGSGQKLTMWFYKLHWSKGATYILFKKDFQLGNMTNCSFRELAITQIRLFVVFMCTLTTWSYKSITVLLNYFTWTCRDHNGLHMTGDKILQVPFLCVCLWSLKHYNFSAVIISYPRTFSLQVTHDLFLFV